MKLSIHSVSRTTINPRGVEMTVSTVRIREGNAFTWQTAILCQGAVSDPFTSTSKDLALIAHDKIIDHIYANASDKHSKYADFVRSALVDLTETHEERRHCVVPPSSGRNVSIVPGTLQQPTLVAVSAYGGADNVVAFPVVRRQSTGTIPAGAMPKESA